MGLRWAVELDGIEEIKKLFNDVERVVVKTQGSMNMKRANTFIIETRFRLAVGGFQLKPNTPLTRHVQRPRRHPPLSGTGKLADQMKARINPDSSVDAGYLKENTAKPSTSRLTYTEIAVIQSAGYIIPLQGAKGRKVRAWFAMFHDVYFRADKEFLVVTPRPFVVAGSVAYERSEQDIDIAADHYDEQMEAVGATA